MLVFDPSGTRFAGRLSLIEGAWLLVVMGLLSPLSRLLRPKAAAVRDARSDSWPTWTAANRLGDESCGPGGEIWV